MATRITPLLGHDSSSSSSGDRRDFVDSLVDDRDVAGSHYERLSADSDGPDQSLQHARHRGVRAGTPSRPTNRGGDRLTRKRKKGRAFHSDSPRKRTAIPVQTEGAAELRTRPASSTPLPELRTRPIVEGQQRRRTVDNASPGKYPSLEFWSREKEEMWAAVTKRCIVPEKQVDLGDDPRLPIRTYFQEVGWSSMLSPKDYYYPKLVRYFYCNLRKRDPFKHGFAIFSYVCGCRFNINAASLAHILDLHAEGTEWDFTNDPKSISRLVDRSEVMKTICVGNVGNRMPRSADLKPVARVLLNIVQTNILPKGGHREAVPAGYAYVVYCLMKGIKLNLPYLMLSFMLYCSVYSKNPHTCPYPACITAVFEMCDISLGGFERQHIKSRIDKATLTRMRINLPVNQLHPLQVDVSRASASQFAAHTSHGTTDPTRPGSSSASKGNVARPPTSHGEGISPIADVASLQEDLAALKEQQGDMHEQISRIGQAQASLVLLLQVLKCSIHGHGGVRIPVFHADLSHGAPPPTTWWHEARGPPTRPPSASIPVPRRSQRYCTFY